MGLELDFNNYLITDSTDSPNIFPPASSFGFGMWFYVPEVVSAEMTLYDWDTQGADLSRMKLSLTTARTLRLLSSTAAGTTASVQTAELSPGWHSYTITKNGIGSAFNGEIDNNGVAASLAAVNSFDTALTRLNIGRSGDGTDRAVGTKLSWLFIGATLDGTEQDNWRNSGVARTPVGIIGGLTGAISFINDFTATTGTIDLACGREPVFVDDQDVTGLAWTGNTYQTMPASRNGSVLYDNANFDLLMFSDSFATLPSTARLSYHLANELAREAGANFKKILQGYSDVAGGSGNPVVYNAIMPESVVNTANDYEWEANDTPINMAVPCPAGVEILYDEAGPDDDPYLEVAFTQPSAVYSGPLASWIGSGNVISATPITRLATVNAVDRYQLSDAGTSPRDDIFTGSVGVPAPQASYDLDADLGGNRLLVITPYTGLGSTSGASVGDYLQLVGIVGNNSSRSEGIGFGSIADSSWDVAGHGVDTSSSPGSENTLKRYSDEEIQGVVQGFYTPGRRLIFCMSIATESTMGPNIENWIDRMDVRCAALGITDYKFLVISQYCHAVGGIEDSPASRRQVRASALAMDAIAVADPRVCHISLYKLLDGCFFHDAAGFSPLADGNDANGPQEQFLVDYDAEHGTAYAVTPGRTMLDSSSLHLGSVTAARFMAEVVARDGIANASSASGENITRTVSLTNPFSWSPFLN